MAEAQPANTPNPLEVLNKALNDATSQLTSLRAAGAIPADVKKAIHGVLGAAAEVVVKAEDVEKRNPQFSKERMAALQSSLKGLATMYKEVDPEGFKSMMSGMWDDEGTKVNTPNGSPPGSGIMDLTKQAPLQTTSAEIVKALSTSVTSAVQEGLKPLNESVAGITKRLDELEKTKGVTKALDATTTDKPVVKEAGSFWKGVL